MDNQCGYSQFAGHVYADANEQRRTSHGVNSSAYANDMLLDAAAVLNSALKAAEPKYQHRVTMDMMHLQVSVQNRQHTSHALFSLVCQINI